MQTREALLKALALTPSLYKSVFQPSAMPPALGEVAEFLGCQMARGCLMRMSDRHLLASHGYGVAKQTECLRGAAPDILSSDPRLSAALEHPNAPTFCRDVLSTEALHASQFHAKFLAPFGIEYTICLPVVRPDDNLLFILSAMRGPREKPFGKQDLDRFALLVPTILQVGAMLCRGHDLKLAAGAIEVLFNMGSLPIFMLDGAASIARANVMADEMIASEAYISRRAGKLVHADTATNDRLAAAVSEVVSHPRLGRHARVHNIPLPRKDQPYPLIATVCSLAPERGEEPDAPLGWPIGSGYAAVYICDPNRVVRLSEQRIKTVFSTITNAEANVLCQMAAGRTAAEIAAARRTEAGTVRSQIKSIMQKTQAHRRFELIRMVLFSEPPIVGSR